MSYIICACMIFASQILQQRLKMLPSRSLWKMGISFSFDHGTSLATKPRSSRLCITEPVIEEAK